MVILAQGLLLPKSWNQLMPMSPGGYRLGGGLRVQTTSTENLSFVVQDQINSTAMTLSNSGAVTGEVIYSAWGETRAAYGTTPTKKLYTGQYEAEAGLYFYNARWYDNQLGRFAQADSIIPEPGNPVAWDRYAGMDNNPIRYNDPSGQSAECGIGDSYCSNLRREYQYSDWQKHLTFNNFILGKEAYIFYYKYEDKAFEDTFLGGEKNSIMWGRIYSEDVLHRLFEPISDFMVLDKIETARDEKDFDLFYTLTSSFALLEWMSADKGFGGGERIASNSLKGYAAIDATKELGYMTRIPPQKIPANLRGQPAFYNPKSKTYISPDVDRHNGGVWKMFDRKWNRLRTYDHNLNWISD